MGAGYAGRLVYRWVDSRACRLSARRFVTPRMCALIDSVACWLRERRDHPEGRECSAAAAAHRERAERAPICVAHTASQQFLRKLHLDVLWHSFLVSSTRTCCFARSIRRTSRPSQTFGRTMPDQSRQPFQVKKALCFQSWHNSWRLPGLTIRSRR